MQVSLPEFQFVEVDRSGRPQNAELRKFVRSNARGRGVSKKATSVRSSAPRNILSKGAQPQNWTTVEPSNDGALWLAQARANFLENIPFRRSLSTFAISKAQHKDFISGVYSNEGAKMTHEPSEFPEQTAGATTSRPFGIANTPYCLYMVAGAPILHMNARTWPFPYPLRGPVPKTSLWMSESPIPPPDVHARRSCLNKTSQPAAFITQSAEYFTYKGQTIRWISDQLLRSQTSADDSIIGDNIIGVILCLTMWEIGRSYSRESAQHMQGIQRIVDSRGGLHNLKDSFQLKILLVDVYVAVVTNGIPLFHALRLATPRPAPLPILGLGELSIADSPLYRRGNRRLDSALLDSDFGVSSIRLLQHMADLTDAFTTDRPKLAMLLADDLFIIHPAVEQPSALFSIVQSTAFIYRAAFLTPPRPISSPLNHQHVASIVRSLSSPDGDETWVRYPGILLWIILVGTVAANNHPERSFFIHFYGKIISVARWHWWEEVIGAFQSFFPIRRIGDEMRR